MKFLLTGFAMVLIMHVNVQKPYSALTKKVLIYTTANKTDLRITLTDSLHFSYMGQPVETQVCVFVDPQQKFQKLIGIGGALTDASAETFYKIPAVSQQELLKLTMIR